MLNYCIFIVIFFIILIIIGLFTSKEIINKILFVNALTSIIVLFICILSTFKANNQYIDIAIIYMFLSFIAVGGYLRFFLEVPIKHDE